MLSDSNEHLYCSRTDDIVKNRHQTILKQLFIFFYLVCMFAFIKMATVCLAELYHVIMHWVCLLIMSEQIYGSIFFFFSIFQPETHKLIYVMLLMNEILNMSDILVQKRLLYSKIRFGLFSRVLLWIITYHLRWIFLLHVVVFVKFHKNKKRKITLGN